jgi:hypothetical protein
LQPLFERACQQVNIDPHIDTDSLAHANESATVRPIQDQKDVEE